VQRITRAILYCSNESNIKIILSILTIFAKKEQDLVQKIKGKEWQ
jgi:hypothetical protein